MQVYDQEAFVITNGNYDRIVKEHWRKLFAIAYRRVKDEALAKDLVQDAFMSCWDKRHTIRNVEAVPAYLRTVLRNRILEHFRKLDIESRAFDYLYEQALKIESSASHDFIESDLRRALQSGIEIMPDTMRRIFTLRMRDYTVEEIAETLKLARKTVRNNLSLGIETLKKTVSKDFPGEFPTLYLLLYIFFT